MAQLPEFDHSHTHVLLYPPQPEHMVKLEGWEEHFSGKMYGMYLKEMRGLVAASGVMDVSFLQWRRAREYNPQTSTYVFRDRQDKQTTHKTMVVACRYLYELNDVFWGQMVLSQIPHFNAQDILPKDCQHVVRMHNFAGMLEYP